VKDLTFKPRINFDKTEYRTFDKSSTSVTASWERPLLTEVNLLGIFSYSWERTHQFNAEAAVDNDVLTIGTITPALKLDLRDDPLSPTSGFYGTTSFDWADPIFLSQRARYPIGYTRFQVRGDYFIPMTRTIIWYLSARGGIERSTIKARSDDPRDPQGQIPVSKQFALGGLGSLRGFQDQELNVQAFAIRGTLSYVNYRTQIDFPLTGPMRFGPFLDAANLKIDTFTFGDLRYGTGFGLRYLTPVGPVNFEWGFKISPRPGEDPHQFHFSIGMI
jgi:outer membrane protein insertion porin family